MVACATHPHATGHLFGIAERWEVDSELLALLVEVAAFEAESPRNVGHVEIVASDFGEKYFPFEGFGALLESSLSRIRLAGGRGHFARGQSEAHIFGTHGALGGKQNEALDDVAKFANVAGPGVATEFGDGFA